MNTIAMYLPQFYKVPENDKWWGEGFTDWRAMSMAEPLYAEHKQPKVPLNDFQYDLLDKETFLWQKDLMDQYHIYGLCFYHYWFKNGRRILEKPAENLLQWKDIDIPFCFSWANESWIRSWSNVGEQNGWVWANNFETDEEHIGNGILLEQDYGNLEDWTEHFNYLLPFFRDSRYIKKDNKPLLLIYRHEDIHCLKEMRKVWDELAKSNGFDGIYIIANFYDGTAKDFVDAMLVTEPGTTIDRAFSARYADKNRMEVARYLSYDTVWQKLLEWLPSSTAQIYFGGFTNYDDTPRRGSAGTVIYNDTPEKFKVYLADLYAKNKAYGNEFVFINAWNEWGEGMHLEPDEEYRYGFLEAVKYAEKHYTEELYKYTVGDKQPETDMRDRQLSRYRQEVRALSNWLFLQEQNADIATWLMQRHYGRIGIYGLGELGRHLLTQLEQYPFEFLCCIDRNAKGLNLDIPVFLPDEIPELDLLIVTNIHIYDDIYDELCQSTDKIMSLESLIDAMKSES
ncbi:MAG: hypothetical protein HFI69_12385 [Lachnospiraceae bacterium]|nr:hypothetical protein [Lachnospiraceae bacterium]